MAPAAGPARLAAGRRAGLAGRRRPRGGGRPVRPRRLRARRLVARDRPRGRVPGLQPRPPPPGLPGRAGRRGRAGDHARRPPPGHGRGARRRRRDRGLPGRRAGRPRPPRPGPAQDDGAAVAAGGRRLPGRLPGRPRHRPDLLRRARHAVLGGGPGRRCLAGGVRAADRAARPRRRGPADRREPPRAGPAGGAQQRRAAGGLRPRAGPAAGLPADPAADLGCDPDLDADHHHRAAGGRRGRDADDQPGARPDRGRPGPGRLRAGGHHGADAGLPGLHRAGRAAAGRLRAAAPGSTAGRAGRRGAVPSQLHRVADRHAAAAPYGGRDGRRRGQRGGGAAARGPAEPAARPGVARRSRRGRRGAPAGRRRADPVARAGQLGGRGAAGAGAPAVGAARGHRPRPAGRSGC